VTHSDRDTTSYVGLTSDVGVKASHLFLVDFGQLGCDVLSGIDYVLLEEFLVERLVFAFLYQRFIE
jgi:hypothetical protein